jgi:predicted Zn finger-like uncharacterized protein
MPIQTPCPHCGTTFKLSDALAGKKVRCRECSRPFTVGPTDQELLEVLPARAAADLADKLQTGPALRVAPRLARNGQDRPLVKSEPSRSRSPMLLLVLVLGGVALAVGVVVLGVLGGIYLMRSDEPARPASVAAAPKPLAPPLLPPPAQPVPPPALLPDPPALQPPLVEKLKPQPEPPFPLPPARLPPMPLPPAPPVPAERAPEPEIPWEVKPDPLPEPIRGPFDLAGSIPVAFMGQVIFPTSTSPFVAVTPAGTKDQLRVHDLRNMKPVGPTIEAKINPFTYSHLTLSQDGAYLAARTKGQSKSTVEIWSSTTGKSVRKFEVDADPRMAVGLIDFIGKDRLLTMKHQHEFPDPAQEAIYQVWDVSTGKEVAKFSYGLVFHRKWGGFSPGRKYLVMEQTETLKGYHLLAFDLATARPAGEFAFQDRKDQWGQAAGISFSPDGREMAMLWRLGNRPDCWGRLLVWNVASHEKVLDHRIGYEPNQIDSLWFDGGTRTLQWLPDGSGWLLFSHRIIDRASGAVVWKLTPEPRFSGEIQDRRFLDRDHVTSLEGTFDKKLRVVKLPRAEIDAAVKAARK